ncbi:hypothetical protein halTADL_3025 [Halohasta litchfieldiae]|jgi:hypothetical protein|uniref:DUF8049 domain-containing protein n=1 Tax=Halohasta litchfieldiae TaxID=1073996 RepID=A0A1H6RGR2_9EURY|nr:hypothetical protein [Halohasta litchfieldiae]ATW89727.1 hypothetical protein halTADL_3025 [Halohasta litchfieldiae]SEI53636.1 hypothetical protein SAMN05444271_102100 [Halohasta litchfieldiae]
MDLEDAWTDTLVATGVAATTIVVTVLLVFVFAVDTNPLLRLSPLGIYFVYLFTHRRLPEGVDTPRNWIALTALVGIGVLLVAAGLGG